MEDEEDLQDFLDDNEESTDEEEIRAFNRVLRRRRLRLRQEFDPLNPNHCPPNYFRKYYRMSQNLARRLLDLIRDEFDVAQRESHITVNLELCTALRMYASGGYQTLVAHDHFSACGQPSVSRILHRFTDCLLNIADQFIYFPRNREERQEISLGFQRFTRIPGILGMIDGTIIKFLRPTENEEAFYNYRHKHSMNVQIVKCNQTHGADRLKCSEITSHMILQVSDHRFLIRSISVLPGSNTDRHIWNNSDVKRHMEALRCNFDILFDEMAYYLIGDSGYSPSPVMLTPIRNAVPGTPDSIYTRELCSTRSRQEQTNGKLVNKWRICKRERAMRYTPVNTARIIIGSAVLHNFIILNGEPNPNRQEPIRQDFLIPFDNAAGLRERNAIIREYFTE